MVGPQGPAGPTGPQGPPGPVNYPGTGSLSAAHTLAPPVAINLSTEGVSDWFAPANSVSGNYHSKMLGGQMAKSFDWVAAGQILFTQTGSFSVSSIPSDDASGLGLTSLTNDQGVLTSSASLKGFGFRLRAPASSTAVRTLKIYCSSFSTAFTLTAHLSDGSAADVTDTVDVGSDGYNYFVWTVTYQAARDGQEVEVSALVSTNYGFTPNVKFVAATLH